MENKVVKTARGDYLSRMALTRLHLDKDRAVPGMRFGVWNRPKIDRSQVLDTYVLTQSDIGRLDNVAYRYYGVEAYWWVLADVNGIKNVFRDMEVGKEIVIPMLESVEKAIIEGSEARLD